MAWKMVLGSPVSEQCENMWAGISLDEHVQLVHENDTKQRKRDRNKQQQHRLATSASTTTTTAFSMYTPTSHHSPDPYYTLDDDRWHWLPPTLTPQSPRLWSVIHLRTRPLLLLSLHLLRKLPQQGGTHTRRKRSRMDRDLATAERCGFCHPVNESVVIQTT